MSDLKEKFSDKTYLKNIKNELRKLQGKQVLVYGAGLLFEEILKLGLLNNVNIVAVTDKKFTSDAKFYNYKAIAPESLVNYYFEAILITLEYSLPIKKYLETLNLGPEIIIKDIFSKDFCFQNNDKESFLYKIKSLFRKKPKGYCQYIKNLMMSFDGQIGYCRPHILEYSKHFSTIDLNKYIENLQKDKERRKRGECEYCSGCTYLKAKDDTESNFPINFIDLNFASFCNLRCVYCYIPVKDLEYRNVQLEEERFNFIKEILDKKLLNPKGGVSFSGGEPTITSVFEKTCKLLIDYSNKIDFTFVTNCTQYSPQIELLMKSDTEVSLLISVDSFDENSYLEVKGRNLFYKVIENLKKYKNLADNYPNNNINIKFIIMPSNAHYIDKFLDLAASLGFNKDIYYDIDNRALHFTEQLPIVLDRAVYFCKQAKKLGLNPIAESTGLSLQYLKDKINAEIEKE